MITSRFFCSLVTTTDEPLAGCCRETVRATALAASLLLVVGLPLAAAGQDAEAEQFVVRYAEVHASGDVDALLALHTPDAEFVLPGHGVVGGGKELRDLFEFDAAVGARLSIDRARSDGDDLVLGAIVERNAVLSALGLGAVHYLAGTRLVFRDTLIARTEAAALDSASQAALMRAMGDATSWLGRYRAAELAVWMPGGRFRHSAAAARWWLAALADWRAWRDGASPERESAERIGRALMNAWATGDVTGLADIVAPEAVYEENVEGGQFTGPAGFASYIEHVHGWATDVTLVIDRVSVASRLAHFEWRMTAVQDRPIGSRVPVATYRTVEIRGATLVEIRGGMIVRASDHLDALGFVLGLGARVELPGGVTVQRP